MRAVQIPKPGHLDVIEVPGPEPGPGEVVVDVAFAGICASDLEVFTGRRPADFVAYPVIPGHEWAGTVAAVGNGVDGRLVGRKVVGEGFRSCGSCTACHAGEQVFCHVQYDEIGFTRPGAWAEQLLLPAQQLHLLDDDAELRSAAGLEPAACAAAASALAAVHRGERVAVVGGGSIGALVVQLITVAGPEETVVVEPNGNRADVLERCGATRVIGPARAARHAGRFDVVVEAAGAPAAIATSLGLVRRNGRVVLAGVPDAETTLGVRDVVTRGLELKTVFGAPHRAWQSAVDAFRGRWLDPGLLVSHDFGLRDARSALDLLASGDPMVGKVLLQP